MEQQSEWCNNNLDPDTGNKIKKIVGDVQHLTDAGKQVLLMILKEKSDKNEKKVLNSLSFDDEKLTGYAHALSWIEDNLESEPNGALAGSLTKNEVYKDYCSYCASHDLQSVGEINFGRVLHIAFPGVQDRRLGGRQRYKYCYSGIRRKIVRSEATQSQSVGEACEAVICEWAEKSFRQEFRSLQSLAEFLVQKAFVNQKSKNSLRLISHLHKNAGNRNQESLNFAALSGKSELKKKLLEKGKAQPNDRTSNKSSNLDTTPSDVYIVSESSIVTTATIRNSDIPSAFVPVVSSDKSASEASVKISWSANSLSGLNNDNICTVSSASQPVKRKSKMEELSSFRSASVPADNPSLRLCNSNMYTGPRPKQMTVADMLKAKRMQQNDGKSSDTQQTKGPQRVSPKRTPTKGLRRFSRGEKTANINSGTSVMSKSDKFQESVNRNSVDSVAQRSAETNSILSSQVTRSSSVEGAALISQRGSKRLLEDISDDNVHKKMASAPPDNITDMIDGCQSTSLQTNCDMLPEISLDMELELLDNADLSGLDDKSAGETSSLTFPDFGLAPHHRHSAPILETWPSNTVTDARSSQHSLNEFQVDKNRLTQEQLGLSSCFQNPPMTPVGKFRPVQTPTNELRVPTNERTSEMSASFYKDTYCTNDGDNNNKPAWVMPDCQPAETYYTNTCLSSAGDTNTVSRNSSVCNLYSPVQYSSHESSPLPPMLSEAENTRDTSIVTRSPPSYYTAVKQKRSYGGLDSQICDIPKCLPRPDSLRVNLHQNYHVFESNLSPDSPYSSEVQEILSLQHYTSQSVGNQHASSLQAVSQKGHIGNLLQDKLQTHPQEGRGLHLNSTGKAKRNLTQFLDSGNQMNSPQFFRSYVPSMGQPSNMADSCLPNALGFYDQDPRTPSNYGAYTQPRNGLETNTNLPYDSRSNQPQEPVYNQNSWNMQVHQY